MTDTDHAFQALCHEAVQACGAEADMAEIERYVLDRIDGMDPATRTRIKRDLERVLAFRAPSPTPQSH